MLVLKSCSLESYPQIWDDQVQFGINLKFQNAFEKVQAFLKNREILRTDNG